MKKLLVAVALLFMTMSMFAEVQSVTNDERTEFMNWFSQRGYVGEDGSSRFIKTAWEDYLINAEWEITEYENNYDRYNQVFKVYFPYVSGQIDFIGTIVDVEIHFYAFEQSDGFIGFGFSSLTLRSGDFKEEEDFKSVAIISRYLESEVVKKAFSK